MSDEDPAATVALELERLRGVVTTGFATVNGSLAVIVERGARTEQDVKDLRADTETGLREVRADTEAAIAALRTDVDGLKSGRWPIQSIGAIVGVVGAVAAVIAVYR